MNQHRPNAIVRRIQLLTDYWNDFAVDPEARLLRWLTDEEGERMLDVFFTAEAEEEAATTPDIFVPLEVPFTDPGTYGWSLAQQLSGMYEHDRKELAEQGLDADWHPPDPRTASSDVARLLDCCRSLRDHYSSGGLRNLALVLRPGQVTSEPAFSAWLEDLLLSGVPEGLRFTCLDSVARPVLTGLAERLPTRITTVQPQLNMHAAMMEIVQSAGNRGPGQTYQRLFLEIANLGQQGHITLAATKARQAAGIARGQGWPALETAVYLMLAALQIGAGDFTSALTGYRSAADSAAAAIAKDEPGSHKLLVQARFGEGATLISQERFGEAAAVYESSVPAAEQAGDLLMVLEAWRMAGHCHEQGQSLNESWRCNWAALAVAEKMEPTARKDSTLPWVGAALVRISRTSYGPARESAVAARMTELAGPEWARPLEPGGHAG